MSQFMPEKPSTQQQQQESKGPEAYLSSAERKALQRSLSFPEDLPERFKSWILDHVGLNIPQIPISQISGFKRFQPDETIAYTPTWTSSGTQPSLGDGTLTGGYLRTGKLLLGNLQLTIGSTTTTGTGRWLLSTPVAIVQSSIFGTGYLNDTGVAVYMVFVHPENTTSFALRETDATLVDATNPFSFASGDVVNVNFACQAA